MLPKRERISRPGFPKGRGESAAFSFGTVRIYPSDSFRASVVISKKTIRSAVLRHKAKRKGYGALSALKGGRLTASYVFYPNQKALSESVAGMAAVLSKKFK